MLELLVSTFVALVSGASLLYLLLGVLLGLIVGILPALGTTAGMALLIPFVFGMSPEAALPMMIGLLAVVATGDTVTSILMGIPGGSGSQATVLDGFPMARRGEAARALSAAYFASMLGGLVGAIVLTGAIVVARPMVLAFGTGEMLLLVLLGITMVSTLSGPSLSKGLVSAGLGLMFGAIGAAPATGDYRLSFGTVYLSDGLQIGIVALAIFALPEIIDLLRRGTTISKVAPMGRGWLQGIRDTLRHKWLVLRCSAIGCLIGALPIGGADWFAYGHAVQSAKDREGFGKGDVRGVIGPEAANNANQGGALVPTLLFGIPGSGPTAILLGGLVLLGVEPGPSMLDKNLGLTYTMLWSLALANVFGTAICFMLSGQMARITRIPFVYLGPLLLVVVLFGALQTSQSWEDVWTLGGLGLVGVFLRRFGYSRPAFLVGFVLCNNIETLLYQTVQIYSLSTLMERPLIWVLLALTIGSLVFGLKYRPSIETEGSGSLRPGDSLRPQYGFIAVVMLACLGTLWAVYRLDFLASVFPMSVSLATLACALTAMVLLGQGGATSPLAFDSERTAPSEEAHYQHSLTHYLLWIAALFALIFVLGFLAGVAAFLLMFFHAKAPAERRTAWVITASMVFALWALGQVFELRFPPGYVSLG